MKYFFILLFICSVLHCMDLKQVARVPKESNPKILETLLTGELLAFVEPERVENYLTALTDFKRSHAIPTDMLQRILITARTAQELAQVTAHAQVKGSGSKVRAATDNYINAQLNYQAICNYLSIKP